MAIAPRIVSPWTKAVADKAGSPEFYEKIIDGVILNTPHSRPFTVYISLGLLPGLTVELWHEILQPRYIAAGWSAAWWEDNVGRLALSCL
jgi:hypothetical protein